MSTTAFRLGMGAVALVGLLLMVMLGAAYAQQLAPITQNATVAKAEVNLAPLLNVAVEFAAAVLAALAIPMFWALWGWLQNRTRLSKLQISDAQRAVIDQGLQKAIGYAVAQFQDRSKALIEEADVSFTVRNAVVAHAANYAIDHIPEALAHVGIGKDTPEALAGMIEARLGMIAIGKSTAPISAGTAMATDPASMTAGA